MQVAEWSENMETYDLSSEYSIRKADPEEWGIYCSVYYNMRFVGFFREERFSANRNNAYWIYQGASKKLVGCGWHPIIYIIYFSFHRSIS